MAFRRSPADNSRARVVCILCILVLSIAQGFAADTHGVVTTPIGRMRTTDTGQELNVPAHPTVIVSQTTMVPGARTPTHKHPYPRYVYVLDGTLTVVDVATERTFEVRKGGFLMEMIDTWHYGENRGTVPVKLIAIDQVPEGTRNNIVVK